MSRSTAHAAAPVTLRLAREDDHEALRRLAELDSAHVPPEPVMVAEGADGLLVAMSIADGATIADPFAPTAALVELLRLRVVQLRAESPRPTSSDRGRRSLAARAARLVGLLGAVEERRAAAYGMSGSQALVAETLAGRRRRG